MSEMFHTFYLEPPVHFKGLSFVLLTYRFLRSVAYRQFTRLLWDYIGSSKHFPLPCCAYSKIRKHFPSEDRQYQGFEDEDT